MTDIRGDVVLVALDLLIRVLQALRFKRRFANKQSVPTHRNVHFKATGKSNTVYVVLIIYFHPGDCNF